MSSEEDVPGPAPSPSAAVVARRAGREAKSMREESGSDTDAEEPEEKHILAPLSTWAPASAPLRGLGALPVLPLLLQPLTRLFEGRRGDETHRRLRQLSALGVIGCDVPAVSPMSGLALCAGCSWIDVL